MTRFKSPIRLIGAGRTDAGVHALGQVAHFSTTCACQPNQILYALNGMLPDDIRIISLETASDTFHAQISALSKEYHYHLWLEQVINPLVSRYRHHFCYQNFSLPLLEGAAQAFVGIHNFATFANVGNKVSNTIRNLKRLTIVPQEGGVRLEFEGDGFLYKMVRNIVGTLLEIGLGKRASTDLPLLFAAQDRRIAGPSAPAKGLILVHVNY
jgi:tRNA pseudouridine38-40 synthase